MRATELQQMPRCLTICEDTDTHRVVQCARWAGHVPTHEHMSYDDVIIDMYIAVCRVRGLDPELLEATFQGITLVHMAKQWYKRLVDGSL